MAIKLLNPSYKQSFNQKFRQKRFKFFMSLLDKVRTGGLIKILDVGGEENYWERMGFADNNVHITLLNLKEVATKSKNFVSVKGDACNLSEYKNGEFDIVFSNSVIEHLFSKENQRKMANEVRRVGKNYYIQTPNYYFPIEPHWLFPCFQYLPFGLRVFLTKNFDLGHYKKSVTREAAIKRVDEVKLLKEKEMKELFPDGKVYREVFFGLTKSISLHRFPGN
jgi:SAM-dependent methyltransferase